MSWLYVPGMEGSPSDCQANQDIGLWVVLSGTPTQRQLSWRGWKARSWIALLCGTISKPSTADRGAARWISSLPGSPANPSPLPASGKGLRMLAGSGRRSPGWWVKFDPDGSCWRTFHRSSSTASPMSSTTLPRSGSMRNGVCSPRQPLEPPTSVNGSGSWPTPKAGEMMGGMTAEASRDMPSLKYRAVMWGTPAARDDQKSPEAHMAMKARMDRNTPTSLTVQAKMWPTPAAHNAKGDAASQAARNTPGLPTVALSTRTASHHAPTTTPDGLNGQQRAVLSPRFVEALMGLPNGWLTPSISAATGSSRNAPEPPGVSWLRALLNLPTTTDH